MSTYNPLAVDFVSNLAPVSLLDSTRLMFSGPEVVPCVKIYE